MSHTDQHLLGALLIGSCALVAGPMVAAQNACMVQRLQPSDSQQVFKSFGRALAIDGDTVIVGAPWDNQLGTEVGAAYVFQQVGHAWIQMQKLLAGDGGMSNQFGQPISLDGDLAMIGALGHWHDGAPGTGAVYVWTNEQGSWREQQEIVASDGIWQHLFGHAISVHDHVALAGAPLDNDNGTNSGATYFLRFDGSSWIEEQKVIASDGAAGDFFGRAVAIQDDLAVVGATGHDVPISNAGAAYVFRYKDTAQWIEVQKLSPATPQFGQRFGFDISISGDVMLIGTGQTPSAFIFVLDHESGLWIEHQKLAPADPSGFVQFGRFVALEGDIALIGAPEANTIWPQGAAFVFRKNPDGQWIESQLLLPDPNPTTSFFGQPVAISNGIGVIGAHGEDQQLGAAYIFDLNAKTGDLNCDGAVDVQDLLLLLGAWGACANPAPGMCPADLNGDGIVNVFDLLLLLANWE